MKTPWLTTAALIACCGIAGCSHVPSTPATHEPGPPALQASQNPPSYHPGNCNEFCGVIHACAKQADHEEMSGQLCRISRCETGNKCRGSLDSPSRKFRGPFQFLTQTWNRRCRPIFLRKKIEGCSGKGAIHDTCCSTICAAEIIAQGGIGNWPTCGT